MTTRPDTAMVLAAGLGTRMRPLTDDRPKPLIPVAGKALIDYALDGLDRGGVARAVVNVHYFAHAVEAHLAGRRAPAITVSDERGALLETGGGLAKARPLFAGAPAVFCTNTDAILVDGPSGDPYARLADAWRPEEADMLLMLAPIGETSGYSGAGDIFMSPDGRLTFRGEADRAPFVFTGLQILNTDVLDAAPGGAFSTKVLWEAAQRAGRLRGVVHDGFWLHVGDPAGLAAAEARLGG
ncbi:MAG: nucleotidyltransferase family protein [Pseudomonadota bacterium]